MRARPRRQAIVEIVLRDGRRLSHRTRAVRGTADNPMTRSEVEAKARDLMVGVLGSDRAEKLVEAFLAQNSFTEKQMGQAMGMFMKVHGQQVDAGLANGAIKRRLAGK